MSVPCTERFDGLCTQFSQIRNGKTESEREVASGILDELNSIDYRYTVVTKPTRAVLLINQCCSIVAPEDSHLVAKCCQLFANLVNRHQVVVEGKTLALALRWSLNVLSHGDKGLQIDLLVTLDGLIRSNTPDIHQYVNILLEPHSPLMTCAANANSLELIVIATQCLEACTVVPENYRLMELQKFNKMFVACSEVFFKHLLVNALAHKDDLFYCKILMSCISGLENIAILNKEFRKEQLGLLLSVARSYMLYQISNVDYVYPRKLMPSTMSIPEQTGTPPINREVKGGKVTKARKLLKSMTDLKRTDKDNENQSEVHEYVPANYNQLNFALNEENACGYGSKLKTSESDYSDNESGSHAKLHAAQSRVRQAALKLLFKLIWNTDYRTIFSYWSSFIPDTFLISSTTLTTSFLKDPSIRGRTASLNVLLLLLVNSRSYLCQAEYSQRTTSFTPYSVILGSTITALHKYMSLALAEKCTPVLIQVLKCYAALVQATPYHRLQPGLVTKTVRIIKPFLQHKDVTVQVSALIVMGCVVAHEPILPEVQTSLLRNLTNNDEKAATESHFEGGLANSKGRDDDDELEFAQFSSDDEDDEEYFACPKQSTVVEISWLLFRCLHNIGVNFDDISLTYSGGPLPVKVESLKVISALSRTYFEPILLKGMHYIYRAIEILLDCQTLYVLIHVVTSIEFMNITIEQYLSSNQGPQREQTLDLAVYFWTSILNGTLIELSQADSTLTLQLRSQKTRLRSLVCDSLGSIGATVFDRLPPEKRRLVIMLLFSCARTTPVEDETVTEEVDPGEIKVVKAAAVRALACTVCYPSMREDIGYVVDTAEAIHTAMKDESCVVQIKASWALSNVSNVLVLNKTATTCTEDFPTELLLRIMKDAINACRLADKVRANCMRCIGNFLLLLDETLLGEKSKWYHQFREAASTGLLALVNNAAKGKNMKLRWNACYALNCALRNQLFCSDCPSLIESRVFPLLTDLVVNCPNFKVRIHAALALASPSQRSVYGTKIASVWTALLAALEASENMQDFKEYKHRDNLVDQICLTLGALVCHLLVTDLEALCESVELQADMVRSQLQKVMQRLVPEKTEAITNAAAHLTKLRHRCSDRDRLVVDRILQMFSE